MSTVAANKVVSLHYTLKNDKGEQLETSRGDEPLEYLHGAENLVPGLEKQLEGKNVGDKLSVTVEPADGYGDRDPAAVYKVSRKQFPENAPLAVGMPFEAEDPQTGEMLPAWISALDGDSVTVDFNHPMAGTRLHFDVELLGVRDASAEEVAHGHPHGPHGHHHH